MDFTSTTTLFKQVSKKLKPTFDKREAEALAFIILDYFFELDKAAILAEYPIEAIEPEVEEAINEVIDRLKQNEPIQYVLGETEFYGLSFFVNPSVLIPRPETEELVDLIINDTPTEEKYTVLDIGTGSGCIAISLAKKLKNTQVTAFDISQEALEVAEDNATENEVKVIFQEVDILTTDALDTSYDIIVSNPPYITESEKDFMELNVLDFEPASALFIPDNEPLLFYSKIAQLAAESLSKKGILYLEINEQFGKETAQVVTEAGFQEVTVLKDINGKDRMIKASF